MTAFYPLPILKQLPKKMFWELRDTAAMDGTVQAVGSKPVKNDRANAGKGKKAPKAA